MTSSCQLEDGLISIFRNFGHFFSKNKKPKISDRPNEESLPEESWLAGLMESRVTKVPISEKIFEGCKQAAEQGDPKAQAELSLLLYGRYVTGRNLIKAFKWLEKAADNDPIQLNMTYKRGREFDLPEAYFGLFVMWQLGIGVPKSEKMENKNLLLAAEKGYGPAMHKVGQRYNIGLYGFDLDDELAENWFLKSIDAGYTMSCGPLSAIYAKRNELESAFHFLERAVHVDGFSSYFAKLAFMLIEGRGTHTDKIEAFKWYYMAALQTDYYNKDILALMEEMTEQEIANGIEKAEFWIEEHESRLVRFIRTTQRPSFLDS